MGGETFETANLLNIVFCTYSYETRNTFFSVALVSSAGALTPRSCGSSASAMDPLAVIGEVRTQVRSIPVDTGVANTKIERIS